MSKVSQYLSNKILGSLPSSWKAVQFSDLYDSPIRDFGSFSSTKEITFLDAGVPFIKSEMIKEGYIDWSSTQYISSDVHSILNKSYVRAQTILFSKIGSALGKAVVYEGERGECNSNAAVAKILLDKRKADNYFYTYALNDGVAKKQFYQIIVSLLPRINLGDIDKLVLPLPPLEEQRKIAQILSTWDKAITTTERLLTNRQQQKKALMQRLLTGKQRFAGFEGEWNKATLVDVAKITMGSSPNSVAYNEEGVGLPLLQGNADIKNRRSCPRIFTSQITKECLINDILLSVRAPVGSVATALHNACIGRGIASIRAVKGVSQNFLYQWLLDFEPKWERYSQGSTFESVNSDDIKLLHILIPSIQEQQKIASVLSTADAEITTIQNQLDNLKQQKKALMQQLLTGKRRVKVDSPALATQ